MKIQDECMVEIQEQQMYIISRVRDIIITSIKIVLFIKELCCGRNYLLVLDNVRVYLNLKRN